MRRLVGRFAITLLLMLSVTKGSVAQQDVHAAIMPQDSRKPAPEFRLTDASDRVVQVSDYRGKVVLLNFWATECGGCKMEIPWFVELERTHQGSNFTAVGVSMDISFESLKNANEAWNKVKPFAVDHKLNYPILMGDDAVSTAYDLVAFPATYLIDKRGRIAATYVGVVDKGDIESNVNKLLAER